MKIRDAAMAVGVPASTIRYWERAGLVRIPRAGNGYRRIDAATLARLRFLARAQRLGFRLREIEALLALIERAGCEDVRAELRAKAGELGARIAELARMREELLRFAEQCTGRAPCSFWVLLSQDAREEVNDATTGL